jgi:hypothetical protein
MKKGTKYVFGMTKEQNGLRRGDLHPLNKTLASVEPLSRMEIMFVRKIADLEGTEKVMPEGRGLKMDLLPWCKTHVLVEPLSRMEIMFVRKIADLEGTEKGMPEGRGLKMDLLPWCKIVDLPPLRWKWRQRGTLKRGREMREDQ